MKQTSLDFLYELIETPSPSGFEEKAAALWQKHLNSFKIKTCQDTYGNTFATFNPGGFPKIMLVGHIDEVGFMVKYISDEGFIYFDEIGGVDPYISLARNVEIYSEGGPIPGVIGTKAIHLIGDEEREINLNNLYIDIGASCKEDAQKYVSIGDPIIFDSDSVNLLNNRLSGRGLDDKVGAWCVAEILKSCSCKAEVIGVASIQEENGAFGAHMSALTVSPDVALAIDVTHATDIPDLSKEKFGDIKLGGGPVISIGSSVHKRVSSSLLSAAKKKRMSVQIEISPKYTGTDADAIFLKNGGIPTGLVSIPTRYMHSPIETVQIEDLENTIKLITTWCGLVTGKI